MTYQKFTELLLCEVQSALFPGQKAALQEILKNNDTRRLCLVLQNQEETIRPVIYLEDFYAMYQKAKDAKEKQQVLSSILSTILSIAQDHINYHFPYSGEALCDYNFCQDKICLKLICRKTNESLLKDTPYLPFQDLCIVFFLHLSLPQKTDASVLIKQQHLEKWKLTPEEIFPLALHNTMHYFPPEISTVTDIHPDESRVLKPEYKILDLQQPFSSSNLCNFYILTNTQNHCGASVVLYPKLLDRIAECLNSSFYLLPSSIHEMLVIPDHEGLSPETINEMIREVNHTEVAPEEILGETCYYFDKRTGSIL